MQARLIRYSGSKKQGNLIPWLSQLLDKFVLFTGVCVFHSSVLERRPPSLSYYLHTASAIDILALGKQYGEGAGPVAINSAPTGGSNCVTISSLGKVIVGLSPLTATTISLRYVHNRHQRVAKQERGAIVYGDLQVGHAPGLAHPSCLRGLRVSVVPASDIFTRLVQDATIASTQKLPVTESAHPHTKTIVIDRKSVRFDSLPDPWKESLYQLRKSMGNAFPEAVIKYEMSVYDCIIAPRDAHRWISDLLTEHSDKVSAAAFSEPVLKVAQSSSRSAPVLSVLFRMAAKMPHKLLASPHTGRGFQDSLLLVTIHSLDAYEATFCEY